LGVFLSVLTLFLLISYTIRFFTDTFRARDDWAEIDIQLELEKEQKALRSARAYDEAEEYHSRSLMHVDGSEPCEVLVHSMKVSDSVRNRIVGIEGTLKDRAFPKFLWFVRFVFFGFSPIALAALALSHSGPNLEKFISAVFTYERTISAVTSG